MTHSMIAGMAIGGSTGLALMAAEAITGSTTLGAREVVGVAVFTCGLIWWLGRKLQFIEDELKNIRKWQRDWEEKRRDLD